MIKSFLLKIKETSGEVYYGQLQTFYIANAIKALYSAPTSRVSDLSGQNKHV